MTGSTLRDNRNDFGQRFHALMEVVVRWLPFGLSKIVAPSLLGFALINGFTFAVDLVLLTALRSGMGLPVPVAFTVAYVLAFGLSFVLNRALNFRSHAPVGPQAGQQFSTRIHNCRDDGCADRAAVSDRCDSRS